MSIETRNNGRKKSCWTVPALTQNPSASIVIDSPLAVSLILLNYYNMAA